MYLKCFIVLYYLKKNIFFILTIFILFSIFFILLIIVLKISSQNAFCHFNLPQNFDADEYRLTKKHSSTLTMLGFGSNNGLAVSRDKNLHLVDI